MNTRTIVDWLAVRTQSEVPQVTEAVRGMFGPLRDSLSLSYRSRGWQGYQTAADVLLTDMSVGLMAWGGDNQKGWVHLSLSGTGCAWVRDWDTAQEELQKLSALSVRRCDIALDTIGRQVTHQSVVEAYRAGMFCAPGRPGRPPKCQRIESERPEDGRTVYIGARENDKFFRGYEKGLQLAAQSGGTLTEVGGVPVADMYRCELELKAKSGALPDDLIDNRDQYFAGAYPYLQHVLHDVVPEVMVIDRRLSPRLNMERMLEHIRSQYGSTLYTALVVHQGDFMAVWDRICGSTHNDDLVRAGALLIDAE